LGDGIAASGGPDRRLLRTAKRAGYSDAQIGFLSGETEAGVRARRLALGLAPTFKSVDTCAAEFEALTPYYYSTWEDEDEAVVSPGRSVVIRGSGPNRIGQGIEFDYSCVHAAQEIRAAGYDAVMINCNPETVSTDYDTSTRLYFEPLTFEDVMAVLDRERPMGVILTLGGQTPLKLAVALEAAGVPVLIDRFLEDAIEVDVDAVCDGTDVYIGGILEHIEEAGVHSGDSACVLPPHSLGDATLAAIVAAMERLSLALGVRGLINAQFAVKNGAVYCLEVNPRASRTVPFVGKATGVPLAKVAVRVMLGESLASIDRLPPRPAAGSRFALGGPRPWW